MRDHIAPRSIDSSPPRRCFIPLARGTCSVPVPDDAPIAMCMSHLGQAWTYCADRIAAQREATAEADSAAHDLAVMAKFEKAFAGRREAIRLLEADPDIDAPDSVVYYLRFADRIKIGYSRNLGQRLLAIPHDELLAVEPGGPVVEARRHREFVDLRVWGEWFRAEAPLLDHVERLRAEREKWTEQFGEAFEAAEFGPRRRTNAEILSTL